LIYKVKDQNFMLFSQDEVSFELKEKELLVSQRRARKN